MALQLVLANISEMLQLRGWFNSAAQQQSWGGDDFDYPCTKQHFLELLCRSGTTGYSLLTEDHQQLIGFGQLCDRFGCHHLARLTILPTCRGQGLAKILINELIIEALQQQRRDISLYVHRHNDIALTCYKSIGFRTSSPPEPINNRVYFMRLPFEQALTLANTYLASSSENA